MLNSIPIRRLVRFGVVGGTVAGLFTGLVYVLTAPLGLWGAYLVAYPPAVGLHYSLNKWWTFGCTRTDTVRQVSEYLAMVAITFVLQSFIFWLAASRLGLAGWLSAGIANIVQAILTYLIMHFRVFAVRAPGK